MLVYENYSKFITATDTIRRMKDNVEEMGGRMQDLQARHGARPAPLPLTLSPVHDCGYRAGQRERELKAGQAPRRD